MSAAATRIAKVSCPIPQAILRASINPFGRSPGLAQLRTKWTSEIIRTFLRTAQRPPGGSPTKRKGKFGSQELAALESQPKFTCAAKTAESNGRPMARNLHSQRTALATV